MYGEGYDYCQQYAVLPGEMVGELSVGIETFEDEDRPHWPQVNTCTYKEVWIHVPLRWLWLCADTFGTAEVKGVLSGDKEILFCNTVTGKKFRIVSEETGAFSAVLPAGRYEVSYQGTTRKMELVPAKCYQIKMPFAALEAVTERQGDALCVTLKTSGTGKLPLSVRSENVKWDAPSEIKLGETVTFTGRILDACRPYLAVIVPDGDLDNKIEIFGNNGGN